jgi:ribosomal protein S18 acetylase RimI-like enzyme
MTRVQNIELDGLLREEIPVAAAMAARGMRDNPLSFALCGDDPDRRIRILKTMFHLVLASLQRPSLVARQQGVIVGIAALAPPEGCIFRQAKAREKTLRLGPMRMRVSTPQAPLGLLLPMLRLGPRQLSRLSEAGRVTLEHDPKERHQHLELVVVDAGLQGMGIGRLMMDEVCREMDKLPDIGHLETDKRENVRFYEHCGFEVTTEARVLGVQNWYMERRVST